MFNALIFLVVSQVVGPPATPPLSPPLGPPPGPPVTPPTVTRTVSTPQTPPTAPTPAFDPNVVRTQGFLEIPTRNYVRLAAAYQSVLMNLKTEQRDASGNSVLVPLREGMQVNKDQILGNFDDRELVHALAIAQAQLAVAQAELEKQIEIEHARLAAEVAKQEFIMLQETNQRAAGAVTKTELYKAGMAYEQAKAQLKLQEYTIEKVRTREAEVRAKEVEAAQIRIELRKLIAPIAGEIVKIHKSEGEWLREGDPVLEIQQLDTLRAKCQVGTQHDSAALNGKEAVIRVRGSDEEFRGRVVFVYPKIIHGNMIEFFVEVQNRAKGQFWQLLPGQEVSVTIAL